MPRLPPVTMTVSVSGIAEPRLALLLERGDAFLRVVGAICERREVGLDLEALLQRHGQCALHGGAGEAEHRQAVARESLRIGDAGFDRIALDDLPDEADALSLNRIDRATGHDHVERARLADDARQPLRAAI